MLFREPKATLRVEVPPTLPRKLDRNMGPIFRAAAAVIASLALLAEGPPDEAARVFAMSGARTSAVRSYTFNLHVDFKLKTFPYIGVHLDGTGKYERPNLYSIHFRNVPWFGKGFENVKMDPLVPVTWPATYDVVSLAHAGDRSIVEMKDKTDGHVKGVHAELDEDGLRQVQWTYLNGGVIRVEVNPKIVEGFPVPETEDADIQVPGYHVTAHARFDGYKIVTDKTE
jgi:hypothetical protein